MTATTVVALGGNALLRRGEPPEADTQERRVAEAAERLAAVLRAAPTERFVLTHGNGPQVGRLARQGEELGAQDPEVAPYPLDWLDAQSEGMIGYLLERELRSRLPEREVATLLTQVEVAADDPAFDAPSKPVGAVRPEAEARRLAERHGWEIARDGDGWRRVVASPAPRAILGVANVRHLLEAGAVVVCAGGGGIPVVREPGGPRLRGVEAVIDKDRVSARLALALEASELWLLTDVDAVYADYGGPDARPLAELRAEEIEAMELPAGSMGPKAEAAATFARGGGGTAVIGSLDELDAVAAGRAGTRVRA